MALVLCAQRFEVGRVSSVQYLQAPLGLRGPQRASAGTQELRLLPAAWALHECRGYANLCNFIITLAQAVKCGILNTG